MAGLAVFFPALNAQCFGCIFAYSIHKGTGYPRIGDEGYVIIDGASPDGITIAKLPGG